MRVGDVVQRGNQLGMVVDLDDVEHTIAFSYFTAYCGSAVKEAVVRLTSEQRAIVDAAIAAEALRRMR